MLAASAVLEEVSRHAAVLRGFGVLRLALFGSAARGEMGPDSDLDFLVELEHQTFDNYMDTKFFLEDLLKCKVDLVMLEALKPRLKEIVCAEALDAQGL